MLQQKGQAVQQSQAHLVSLGSPGWVSSPSLPLFLLFLAEAAVVSAGVGPMAGVGPEEVVPAAGGATGVGVTVVAWAVLGGAGAVLVLVALTGLWSHCLLCE